MQEWHTRTAHCLCEEEGLAKHVHLGGCLSGVCIPVQVLQGTQKSLSILRNNSKSFVNVHLRLKLMNLSMTEVYSTLTMLYWRKVLKVTILFYVFCACSTKLLNWWCHCELYGEDSVDGVYLLLETKWIM